MQAQSPCLHEYMYLGSSLASSLAQGSLCMLCPSSKLLNFLFIYLFHQMVLDNMYHQKAKCGLVFGRCFESGSYQFCVHSATLPGIEAWLGSTIQETQQLLLLFSMCCRQLLCSSSCEIENMYFIPIIKTELKQQKAQLPLTLEIWKQVKKKIKIGENSDLLVPVTLQALLLALIPNSVTHVLFLFF